jgi:hypothetical protein
MNSIGNAKYHSPVKKSKKADMCRLPRARGFELDPDGIDSSEKAASSFVPVAPWKYQRKLLGVRLPAPGSEREAASGFGDCF